MTRGAVTPPGPRTYYPPPRPTGQFRLHALDWTCRYLPGGKKAFAFHTLDHGSRDLHHQIFGDKTQHSACAHLLSAWRGPLGLPDGLQLDNDIAFVGGHRVRRVFSRFVRLCLAVGVEPIFLPFREPERNALVEELNGLWQVALWRRGRWRSLPQAQQSQPRFRHWYRHEYFPPALDGLTPARASRRQPVVRLSAQQVHDLPDPLPITAGRVHFIRRVDGHGEILILNERWRVGRRWAGQYVWATVWTGRQRLAVYWRRSAHHPVQLIKSWSYRLPKPIRPLPPEFRRRMRRRKMSTML